MDYDRIVTVIESKGDEFKTVQMVEVGVEDAAAEVVAATVTTDIHEVLPSRLPLKS